MKVNAGEVGLVSVFFLTVVLLPTDTVRAHVSSQEDSAEGTQEPASCDDAKRYFSEGQLDKAEKAYLGILGRNPEAECLPEGLVKVAERRCKIAGSLAGSGRSDEAAAIYAAILEWGVADAEKCALEGLLALAPPPTPTSVSKYDQAEKLLAEGAEDEAWTAFIEGIKADPENTVKQDELGNTFWAKWQRVKVDWKVYGGPLIALLVVLLAYLVLRRILKKRSRLLLDVDKFAIGPVDVAKLPDPSDMLVAKIEEHLVRMSDSNAKPDDLQVIEQAVEAPELPELGSVPKEVNAVWDFLTKLIPSNTITLSGVLRHSKRNGAGLSVKLVHSSGNALIGSYTFWQVKFDPDFNPEDSNLNQASGYMLLAEPVAIWTYWNVQEYRFSDMDMEEWLPRWFFGTNMWRSYMKTRIGSRWLLSSRYDVAERYLLSALSLDRENRFALFNLAMVEIETADPDKVDFENEPYQAPIKNLTTVIKFSKEQNPKTSERPNSRDRADQAFIFSNYNLGTIETYKYIRSNGEVGDLAEATRLLELAVTAANEARDDPQPAELAQMEHKSYFITPAVFAMLRIAFAGALMLRSAKEETDKAGTDQGAGKSQSSPQDSTKQPPMPESEKGMSKSGPDAQTIIDSVEEENHFAPNVLYNLACYFSVASHAGKGTDADLDKATAYLKGALRAAPEIAEWAKADPSLAELRNRRKKQFDKLTAPAKKDVVGTPLTAIEGIGPELAKAIREMSDVESVETLLTAGSTPAGRRELARMRDLDLERIYGWVKMADLMRVDGIGGQYAELLLSAGVDTVKELKVQKSPRLVSALAKINSEMNIVDRLPGDEEVEDWIRKANKLTIVLEVG